MIVVGDVERTYQVIVIGAGFSGIYMLHKLREAGLTVRLLEAADDVGGVWYWNRYPGARVDVESFEYQYGFSDELQKGWTWTTRYPRQPEIQRYQHYVVDRLDLRKDMQFGTFVQTMTFDECQGTWSIEGRTGERLRAKYCVMATGALSAARVPEIEGRDIYKGRVFHSSSWPADMIDFKGQSVGIVGTGSSGIQIIPVVAGQAARLTVFQRTPNFTLPANDHPLDPELVEAAKRKFGERRAMARETANGFIVETRDVGVFDVDEDERLAIFERTWNQGALPFISSFNNIMSDTIANEATAEFARGKINSIVADPGVAEKLTPTGYPFGAKRLCLDTDYFETFNRDTVELVDLLQEPLHRFYAAGLIVGERRVELDSVIFATGFDAFTGAMLKIEIRGRGGRSLRDVWDAGPRTYMGLGIAGFPNLFVMTGPGSPTVFANYLMAIEQHGQWISECISYLQENGFGTIEAESQAEEEWVDHVKQVADTTLFTKGNNWYVGANIPGKPRVFMAYLGGLRNYTAKCDEVARNGYEGFRLGRTPLAE